MVKTLGHLLDVRRNLNLAREHIKLVGETNPITQSVEQNVDALLDGVSETITLCSQAAEEIKRQMEDPDAAPAPIKGGNLQTNLTPFQRALAREGVEFPPTIPKYVPTKTEKRLPRILDFTLKQKQKQNRKRTKDNIPL